MIDLHNRPPSQNVEAGLPLPRRVLEFLARTGDDWTIEEINEDVWPYLRGKYDETPQPGTWHPDVYELRQRLMSLSDPSSPEERTTRQRESLEALRRARENTNIRDSVRAWFSPPQEPNIVSRTLRY